MCKGEEQMRPESDTGSCGNHRQDRERGRKPVVARVLQRRQRRHVRPGGGDCQAAARRHAEHCRQLDGRQSFLPPYG